MIDQQWLTIIIILLIVAILFDGIRRMRNAKKDSIKMSLRKDLDDDIDDDVIYGSEFPNGGARTSEAQIDKERIMKARSRYNFGDSFPSWKQQKSSSDQEEKATPVDPDIDSEALNEKLGEVFDEVVGEKIEPSFSRESDIADIEQEPLAKAEQEAPVESSPQQESVITESSTPTEPMQTSLNLDDDVPMLMEEIDSKEAVDPEQDIKVSSERDTKTSPEQSEVTEKSIQNVAATTKTLSSALDSHSANKPHFESKYTAHADKRGQSPQDVIVMNLHARVGAFTGSDLLPIILDNGLRFGAMDIFHYHAEEDGEGEVLFSMANIVKPGTFDLAHFEMFETVGLSFFLTLPVSVGSHMQAFEQMVEVVQNMADALDANLLDENRSVLTRQTIEHYRERVRDFSRKEQLEKNK